MTKLTQYKWLAAAICFWLGNLSSFGEDSWLQNVVNNLPVVKEAKENCDAYSQKINMSTAEVNRLGEQMDKNRDDSAPPETGITHEQAVAEQQKSLAVRWNTQKNINALLPQAQQLRDKTVQYAVSHPNDKGAQKDAQNVLNDYNKLVKWGNTNGGRIWNSTNNLRGQDPGTKYPDAPIKIEPAPVPLPKAVAPSKPGGDASNETKNDGSADGGNDLQNDLNKSYKTEDNVKKLLPLAEQWAQMASNNAKANPDDPVAQANAENAQDDLNKLRAIEKNNNTRITNDLTKKYPADENKPADHAQNNAGEDTPNYPGFGDPISDLIGPGGLGGVMSSEQGPSSTEELINAVSGNNGADGHPSDQTKEVARENAKEIAREATREAANTAREHAKGAVDGMRNCPDGH